MENGTLGGALRASLRGWRETSERCILPSLQYKGSSQRSPDGLSETLSKNPSETPKSSQSLSGLLPLFMLPLNLSPTNELPMGRTFAKQYNKTTLTAESPRQSQSQSLVNFFARMSLQPMSATRTKFVPCQSQIHLQPLVQKPSHRFLLKNENKEKNGKN